MSGIFNGTSAYLAPTSQASVLGSTPTYPVLIGGWAKFDALTASMVLAGCSDDQTSGFDVLNLEARGDVANDPLRAQVYANGTGNNGTLDGLTTGSWLWVGAYFSANNSRQAIVGTTFGTAQTTTRAATGLTVTYIGRQIVGTNPAAYFSGRQAEVFKAQNFAPGDISAIVAALAAGARPINVAPLSSSIVLYQPLRSGVNDSGFVGPSMTANNMTWNATDHPVAYFNSAFALRSNVLLGSN